MNEPDSMPLLDEGPTEDKKEMEKNNTPAEEVKKEMGENNTPGPNNTPEDQDSDFSKEIRRMRQERYSRMVQWHKLKWKNKKFCRKVIRLYDYEKAECISPEALATLERLLKIQDNDWRYEKEKFYVIAAGTRRVLRYALTQYG